MQGQAAAKGNPNHDDSNAKHRYSLDLHPLPSLIPRKYAKRLLRMGWGVARLWGEGYRVFRGGNQL